MMGHNFIDLQTIWFLKCVIWVRGAAAKKFGATEFVNPKDFNKPIQEVKKWVVCGLGFRVQQNSEPFLQNGQSCGVH